MDSRERVVKTLKHEEPDRVPLDLGGTESSGMTGIAYHRLRSSLGLPAGKAKIFDPIQQVAKLEDDVRKLLGIDTVPLLLEPRRWQPFVLADGTACELPERFRPEKENGDWVVRDEGGHVTARMPERGFYFEPAFAPLSHVTEPSGLDRFTDEISSFDYPSFADEPLDAFAERAEKLYKETDLAVVANLCLHLLAAGQLLRGYENFMVDLLVNRKLAHALLERLTDTYVERCEEILPRLGTNIQVVLVNDDLGTQNGPMLSIDCYKEMILPYQKRLFAFIKSKTEAALLLHSCGAVSEFIPYLIEAGVDALNPVQVSAAGMDTARLKREFGRDLTFWGGGCDTQHVLNRGSAREVGEEVRRRITDLAAGGGFVFTQVHNIQPDVPPENVQAMVDALRKHGRYA